MELLYCEHNRKSVYYETLYGRYRSWTCALDKRCGGGMVWGFNEPCVADCTNHFRKPNGERGHSFPYNRIDYKDIPFDDKALRQIEKDKADRKTKAEKMRNQALNLIREADKLERQL